MQALLRKKVDYLYRALTQKWSKSLSKYKDQLKGGFADMLATHILTAQLW